MNDAEPISWLRLLIAFGVVASLLAAMGFALKYLSLRGFSLGKLAQPAQQQRLQIISTLPLDMRHRLLIIRCDDQEHLLLLGQEKDIVIQTNLPRPSSLSES